MCICLPSSYETWPSEHLRLGHHHLYQEFRECLDVGVVRYEILVLLAALLGVYS